MQGGSGTIYSPSYPLDIIITISFSKLLFPFSLINDRFSFILESIQCNQKIFEIIDIDSEALSMMKERGLYASLAMLSIFPRGARSVGSYLYE